LGTKANTEILFPQFPRVNARTHGEASRATEFVTVWVSLAKSVSICLGGSVPNKPNSFSFGVHSQLQTMGYSRNQFSTRCLYQRQVNKGGLAGWAEQQN